jgi:hypothetical protein
LASSGAASPLELQIAAGQILAAQRSGACAVVSCVRKPAPKACATLTRYWDRMVSFFDYPQEHWIHLRTTNIVGSPFHAVRLRTDASRRFKKVASAEAIIWKPLMVARRCWRALCAAPDARRLRGKSVERRNLSALENHADKASRLISFTHLLTRPPCQLNC